MKYAILSALLGLSACGESISSVGADPDLGDQIIADPAPITVVSQHAEFGLAPADMRYDAGTDTMIYSSGGTDIASLPRYPTLNNQVFAGYYFYDEEYVAFRAVSPSGESSVSVGAGELAGFLTAEYVRINSSAVPVVGSATYTGDYVGLRTGISGRTGLSDSTPDTVLTGDVTIVADFANSTLSGSVTNRVAYIPYTFATSGSETASDLIFDGGIIGAQGDYSGSISSGSFLLDAGTAAPTGYSVTSGDYKGLISGTTSGETVGGIEVQFVRTTGTNGGTKYDETGVFLATK